MFNIGDTVLYDMWSVCKIVGTEEQEINNSTASYYLLQPVFEQDTTLYVPQNNTVLLGKMRPLLSESQAEEILASLPHAELIWIEDERLRQQRYQEIITHGDRKELSSLIRTLYLHREKQQKSGRRLHISDENAFHQAKELLFRELAFVSGVTPKEIENKLSASANKCNVFD